MPGHRHPATPGRPRPDRPGRSDRRHRLQARIYAEETTCWQCGGPVDLTITGPTHPWGPVILNPQPAWTGGNPYQRTNAHLAHRICDTAHQQQIRARRRR